MALLGIQIRPARAAEIEVDTLLAFAETLLLNIAGAWGECSLDHKQRLQQVIFPK
jgi:hypothetical protein